MFAKNCCFTLSLKYFHDLIFLSLHNKLTLWAWCSIGRSRRWSSATFHTWYWSDPVFYLNALWIAYEQTIFCMGSGNGSVGRAVASYSRDPRFESSHLIKNFYRTFVLLWTVLKRRKKRPWKKPIFCTLPRSTSSWRRSRRSWARCSSWAVDFSRPSQLSAIS